MKPSPPEPPFVYKPSGSTLHRDVTPAQNIPRSPPLSVPFSLLRSRLVRSIIPFTNLHDSVGRSTPRLSRLSSPVKFKFKSTFFFSSYSQWQQFCAASLAAAASPQLLRTEKPRPAAAPNPLQHRLPTTSTRHPQGAHHRHQARERHSVKINARIATIPLRYHHRPSVIRPMIHVIPTNIAARSIGLRATSHILICKVREIFLHHP
jgi:hypothetical protein